MALYLIRVRTRAYIQSQAGRKESGATFTAQTANFMVNEYVLDIKNDSMKAFQFVVSQICYALAQLYEVWPSSVAVFTVEAGQKVEAANCKGEMRPTYEYKLGTRTRTGLTVTRQRGNWVKVGTPGYNQTVQWRGYTDGTYYDAWVVANPSATIGATFRPTNNVRPAVGLLVSQNTLRGRSRKTLYKYALTDKDILPLGRNSYRLLSSGSLARWRWRRFKAAMTIALPFFADYHLDHEDRVVESAPRMGGLNAHLASSISAIERSQFARSPAQNEFADALESLSVDGFGQATRLLRQQCDWSMNVYHDRSVVIWPSIILNLICELCYLVLQTMEESKSVYEVLGVNPRDVNKRSKVKQKWQAIDNSAAEVCLKSCKNWADYIISTDQQFTTYDFLQCGTSNPVHWNDLTYIAQNLNYVNVSVPGADTLNQLITNDCEKIDKWVQAGWHKWIDGIVELSKLMSYVERVLDVKPLEDYRFFKKRIRIEKATLKFSDGNGVKATGAVTTGGGYVDRVKVESLPSEPGINAYQTIEGAEQIPVPTGSTTLYRLTYSFIIPLYRKWQPRERPDVDNKDDEDEEDKDGEKDQRWDNRVYPLDPDQLTNEQRALIEEQFYNVVAVVDAFAIIAVFATDGVAAPAVAVERAVVKEGFKDGVALATRLL